MMTTRRALSLAVAAAAFAVLVAATPVQGAAEMSTGKLGPTVRMQPFRSSPDLSRFSIPDWVLPHGGTKANPAPIESFYYYQGKPVRLQRSSDQLSVRFRAGVPAASRKKLVRELSVSPQLSRASRLRDRDLSALEVESVSRSGEKKLLASLKTNQSVEFAYPAWVDPKTGGRMLLTDELVVRLKGGSLSGEIETALAARGLAVVRRLTYSPDEYVLRLLEPKQADPLAASRTLFRSGLVVWAEPNFVQELQREYIPSDPLFPQQWYLRNIGQYGGAVSADARLAAAWDIEKGSPATTIAIIDDGVQLSHPDLAANIYTNPGEIPGNGIDDDHNGYVDDVHGWNFVSNSNDPNPDNVADGHGTAVAGVAAARGENGIGISGACPFCKILPIKIASGDAWASNTTIADAIRYASRLADVLSDSWGGYAQSSALQSAIQYAITSGRGGKGSIVLFAAGNSASGYGWYGVSGIPAGTHTFRWRYAKSPGSSGASDDTVWLGWATFPGDSGPTTFTSGFPGWSTGVVGGGEPWYLETDPIHADEGLCLSTAARAGAVASGQSTYLELTRSAIAMGDLTFFAWVSSSSADELIWSIDGVDQDSTSGVPIVALGLSYPAAYPEAIAVGASSDDDCRSYYSQYGPELDLVASSSGGPLNAAIETTDRTGADGYDTGDYFAGFGGTSSATPLAAGVAALVLSRNPGLTEAQVRKILESSADKVSPSLAHYDFYGHSDRYGYGRINAQRALSSTPAPATLSLAQASYPVSEGWPLATIIIRRSGNTSGYASVHFSTSNGSAKAGFDYYAITRTVSFAPGVTSRTVSIPIKDDTLVERNETILLGLSSPSAGAVLGSPSTATVTIVDNDKPGKIASAKLTRSSFKRSQAGRAKVVVRFSPASKKFNYQLSFKKGAKWVPVRSVRKKGSFVGTRKMTVKSLFGSKPIKRGRYRLKLTADGNSKTPGFTVT